jgi:hypothetical protein
MVQSLFATIAAAVPTEMANVPTTLPLSAAVQIKLQVLVNEWHGTSGTRSREASDPLVVNGDDETTTSSPRSTASFRADPCRILLVTVANRSPLRGRYASLPYHPYPPTHSAPHRTISLCRALCTTTRNCLITTRNVAALSLRDTITSSRRGPIPSTFPEACPRFRFNFFTTSHIKKRLIASIRLFYRTTIRMSKDMIRHPILTLTSFLMATST